MLKKCATAVLVILWTAIGGYGEVSGTSGHIASLHYAHPYEDEDLVSFDWSAGGGLYYSTAVPWPGTGMGVYHANGTEPSNVYFDATLYVGSRVTAIGDHVFFNDGGDNLGRWTFNYYRIDPAAGDSVSPVSVNTDLWGLNTSDGRDLWAGGGSSASIYTTPVDTNGALLMTPLLNVGAIGAFSGPLTFGPGGELYYAEGYDPGDVTVYRFTAAEVDAAVADPTGSPLTASNHVWTTLTDGDGCTGLAVDTDGSVVLTITSFTSPSVLKRLTPDAAGAHASAVDLATSPQRMETVRIRQGVVYVSVADGIYTVTAGIQPQTPFTAATAFDNPDEGTELVSFDWDADTNLYYTEGIPWPGTGMHVLRYDGSAVTTLFADAGLYVGSRVTAIGNHVFFNDGGDTLGRWTFKYYRIDPAAPQGAAELGLGEDLWGLNTRNGSDFWAAGGFDAAIYYSPVDAGGNLGSSPLEALGTIGGYSGPLAFDNAGNLYYADGYDPGDVTVYRFPSQEVAAAIQDPATAPLVPDGHVWATLTAGDGATGLATDEAGNVLVLLTSFGNPSELQRLYVDAGGIFDGAEPLATCPARLSTVRCRNGSVFVCSPDGIFEVAGPASPFPADGAVTTSRRPALHWAAAPGATWYQVQIETDAGESVLVRWLEQSHGFWKIDRDLASDNYVWRVRVWSEQGGFGTWSADADFTVEVGAPGTAVPLEPTGSVAAATPTFRWSTAANAAWHYLWINLDGQPYLRRWIEADAEWTPPQRLPAGDFEWWVRGWNIDGYGPWSRRAAFTREGLVPAAPMAATPEGVCTNRQLTFAWQGVEHATWYQVWVGRAADLYLAEWVKGATTLSPSTATAYGRFQWWVRGWSPDGYGAWSDPLTFTVGEAQPTGPVGAFEGAPVLLSWDDAGSADATWYHVWVNSGPDTFWQRWVQRSETGAGAGTARTFTLPASLPAGEHHWWIRPWNEAYGPWSEKFDFTVAPQPLVQ